MQYARLTYTYIRRVIKVSLIILRVEMGEYAEVPKETYRLVQQSAKPLCQIIVMPYNEIASRQIAEINV